jgi:hypothetical protein
MPLNINLLSDDTIARGITPPDVGNFGTSLAGYAGLFSEAGAAEPVCRWPAD